MLLPFWSMQARWCACRQLICKDFHREAKLLWVWQHSAHYSIHVFLCLSILLGWTPLCSQNWRVTQAAQRCSQASNFSVPTECTYAHSHLTQSQQVCQNRPFLGCHGTCRATLSYLSLCKRRYGAWEYDGSACFWWRADADQTMRRLWFIHRPLLRLLQGGEPVAKWGMGDESMHTIVFKLRQYSWLLSFLPRVTMVHSSATPITARLRLDACDASTSLSWTLAKHFDGHRLQSRLCQWSVQYFSYGDDWWKKSEHVWHKFLLHFAQVMNSTLWKGYMH